MSIFDPKAAPSELLSIYLRQLNADPKKPSLAFLDELIFKHQHHIPFETYTRITDFKQASGTLPSLEDYILRLPDGVGGVCWTLARGFHWLLSQLGFEAHYLYMSPGHVCVAVKLENKFYYADVGYGAPFFQAYPLKKTFEVIEPWETFRYIVNGDSVEVARDPGPTKTLSFAPAQPDFLEDEFRERNVWGTNRFLTTLTINKFFDRRLVRLTGNVLYDWRSGKGIERTLNEDEVVSTLTNLFRLSPRYYQMAAANLK